MIENVLNMLSVKSPRFELRTYFKMTLCLDPG